MEKFFTRREAALHLQGQGFPTTEKSLAKYACVGGGPEYQKFGAKRVLYTVSALDEWVLSKLSEPLRTSSHKYVQAEV